MILTGVCKKDFENWYSLFCNISDVHWFVLKNFYALPLSYQYGVYVDFFRQAKNKKGVDCIIHDFYENCIIGFKTEEVIKSAVKHANEIYNSK